MCFLTAGIQITHYSPCSSGDRLDLLRVIRRRKQINRPSEEGVKQSSTGAFL
jgi:hypothetical protein